MLSNTLTTADSMHAQVHQCMHVDVLLMLRAGTVYTRR
jgi:hypothetical protein